MNRRDVFKTIMLAWPALSLTALADILPQTATDPGPITKDLESKLSSVRSIAMEFTQERRLKMFVEPLKSEGMMLIERPDQIRWETTKPYQSIMLGNHQGVAQFELADGAWKKLRLGFPQMLRRLMEQMVMMQQGKLDALIGDYTISATTGAMTIVTMTPKDANVRSMMSSLDMRFLPDMSAIKEVVMNEPGGDSTHIFLRNEKRNVKFPAGTFDQTKPLDLAAVKTALEHGA